MKAHQLKEEKGLGPAKKQKKEWVIEYKWKNEKVFNEFPKDYYKEKYSEEFKPIPFGARFVSLKGAIESLNATIKMANNTPKTSIMYNFYAKDLYKDFRIVNTRTKEIVAYGDKTENTKTSS